MNATSSWFASHWHDVDMTSSCPHHACIAGVTSSHLHHDFIAIAHESRLQSWCMTDPSCITGRPLLMTGRPLHDPKAHDMSNQCINIILTWFDMELHHKTYIHRI